MIWRARGHEKKICEVDSTTALHEGQRIEGISKPRAERLARVGNLMCWMGASSFFGKKASSIKLRTELTEKSPVELRDQDQRSDICGRITSETALLKPLYCSLSIPPL
ncbi:hypothetical protein Tco_0827941, partial [Tanacetum coccineum]